VSDRSAQFQWPANSAQPSGEFCELFRQEESLLEERRATSVNLDRQTVYR
jgi:hypothetical protein